jgi:hypothetical protein
VTPYVNLRAICKKGILLKDVFFHIERLQGDALRK